MRHQSRQRTLHVEPTQRMHKDVELPGPIAEDPHLRRYPVRDQTPQQRPFGRDSHVPPAGYLVPGQVRFPGRRAGEPRRTPGQASITAWANSCRCQ